MIYFKIGNVPIRGRGVLAPMLEYTTLPYRLLSKKYKCSLTYTEMIHINQLLNIENINEIDGLNSIIEDSPTSIQIVGDFTDRKKTLSAVNLLDSYKYFDIIDLNLGCPSSRIISNNSGSALLKNISKVIPIIKEIKETSKKPITVKIRLGYNKNDIKNISKKLLSTNIDCLAIHAKVAISNSIQKSNIIDIKHIKDNTSTPVIYNGDINLSNIKSILEFGFDGLMVGRAALGNPLIFKKIDDLLNNKVPEKITFNNKIKSLNEFIKLCEKYPISFQKLKISVLPFINGISRAKKIRDLISKTKTKQELNIIIDQINKQNS